MTKMQLAPGVSGEVAVVEDAALLLLALQEEQLDLEGNVYSVQCVQSFLFSVQCAQSSLFSVQCVVRSVQRAKWI